MRIIPRIEAHWWHLESHRFLEIDQPQANGELFSQELLRIFEWLL